MQEKDVEDAAVLMEDMPNSLATGEKRKGKTCGSFFSR